MYHFNATYHLSAYHFSLHIISKQLYSKWHFSAPSNQAKCEGDTLLFPSKTCAPGLPDVA